MSKEKNDDGVRLIHGYSRAEAINDGLLVDITEIAKQHGLAVPVAFTRAVEVEWEALADGSEPQGLEALAESLAKGLRQAITILSPQSNVMFFTITKVAVLGTKTFQNPVLLRAEMGPNDDGSPCITIFLKDELD